MTSAGTNLTQVSNFNQTVVLDAIRRIGPISRVEIAQKTNLSSQTVTNITRRLLQQGLIVEAGKTHNLPGKPRTLLELSSSGGYAVGVHLDPTFTSLALLDMQGETVDHSRFTTPSASDPSHAINVIAEAIQTQLAKANINKYQVLGVGIGAPGPVDLSSGIVDSPPHLPQWNRVPLRNDLSKAIDLPVILEKDVVVAATAERWLSRQTNSTDVIIYVGTGIGVGIITKGQVTRGSSGNAGDVAHIIVNDSIDAPLCYCGRRGCATVTASPTSLLRQAEEHNFDISSGPPGESLEDLFTLALSDPIAASLISRAMHGLSRIALVATDLLDPDRLIFSGPFWPLYRQAFFNEAVTDLESVRTARKIHPLQVTESLLGDHMSAMGAGILVLDHFFTPLTEDLMLKQ